MTHYLIDGRPLIRKIVLINFPVCANNKETLLVNGAFQEQKRLHAAPKSI